MSEKDGFGGGFLAGAIFGSVVGGVLGAVLANRQKQDPAEEENSLLKSASQPQFTTEESIETDRHSLEDKIAQLNLAIDDVREQLGRVNDNSE